MKKCTRCHTEKEEGEFRLKIKGEEKRVAKCLPCENEYKREHRKKHNDKNTIAHRKYMEKNKGKVNKRRRENYIKKNKEELKKSRRDLREENKEKVTKREKECRKKYEDKMDKISETWREEEKKQKSIRNKKWREENREYVKNKLKEYMENNKEKVRLQRKKYINDNPQVRIGITLRTRARSELKSGKGYLDLLGCDISFCLKWFKYHFDLDDRGFCWENHGVWHIDHVIPVASFNLSNEEEKYKCFSWKNIAPVYKEYNLEKHDKIVPADIFKQELRVYIFDKKMVKEELDFDDF